MSDSPKATIGLPETKLGIFPAWGGTTKLPRLIGLPAALDIILNGKTLDGKRAKRVGLVDDVVAGAILLDVAKQFAKKEKSTGSDRTKFYIEGNPITRRLIFGKARKAVMEQTHGHYPAPLKAIDVMEYGMSAGVEAGLAREVEEVVPLIMGDVAQNLVRLFFLMEDAKKDRLAVKPRDVAEVGVLGAGVMGGGIAQVVADKTDAAVRMRDINWKALAGGMKAAARIWKKKVERRRMTRGEMQRKLAASRRRRTGAASSTSTSSSKRSSRISRSSGRCWPSSRAWQSPMQCLRRIRRRCRSPRSPRNAKHPDRVVGMHFFNPVDRMPLVEVIRGAKSSDVAVATVANFARKLGKTVVLCNDGPGFVVNRILGPYMNEAGFLLEEGNSIESIDRRWSTSECRWDRWRCSTKSASTWRRKSARSSRNDLPTAFSSLASSTRCTRPTASGKRAAKGLYLYEDGKRKEPDPEVYKVLGIRSPQPADRKAVVERMVLPMINEAALILDEKIVGSAAELDLAMIMGTGFPPFRGGLLRYADSLGTATIVARLDELASRLGARFRPSEPLRRLAQRGAKFYEAYARS